MVENNRNKNHTTNVPAILQKIFTTFGQKPATLWILLAIAALGVILLMIGSDKGGIINEKTLPDNELSSTEVTEPLADSVETKLADELAATLAGIDGVGRVRVKVNLKSQSRKIWERQEHDSKRTSQEQGNINTEADTNNELVFAKDRDGYDRPVLKEELAPEIEGVIVVAEGAQDIKLKRLLIEAVITVLGIPAHRVMVLPGKLDQNSKD